MFKIYYRYLLKITAGGQLKVESYISKDFGLYLDGNGRLKLK